MMTNPLPNFVAALTPAPQPAAASRAAAPQGETPFSRQLEQMREARTQDDARAAARQRPPAPAPANRSTEATAPKPPTPGRSERPPQPGAAQRQDAARNARASDAAASGTTASDGALRDVDKDNKTDAAREFDAAAMAALLPQPADAQAAAAVPAQQSVAGSATPTAAPGALPEPMAQVLQANLQAAATSPMPLPPSQAAANSALASAQPDLALPGGNPLTPPTGRSAEPTAPALAGPHGVPPDPRDTQQGAVADAQAGSWQQAQAAALMESANNGARAEPSTSDTSAAIDCSVPTPLPTALQAAAAPVASAAEASAMSLSTPVTSPEFRAALGVQVSLLARGGVQQAELHLNPAEMGPVSIQIVLDGQQAQVNFGADSAQTRQLIESGMPELASALREAGLTLTGGGVSQHGGGQRQDGQPTSNQGDNTTNVTSGTSADDTQQPRTEQTRRASVHNARGGVDLYA